MKGDTNREIAENLYQRIIQNPQDRGKIISINGSGISTEYFLDYLCRRRSLLLHGSVHYIEGKLKAREGKIFTSNRAVIAIMRSLYSNVGVKLLYPYFIDREHPFGLRIIVPDGKHYESKEKGFVYVVRNEDFKNEPKNSWQFIKEAKELSFEFAIEIGKEDFRYPVEVVVEE